MARILVVEDDPALSRGIIALLKAAGHAADCAKDGETALFLAETEPCCLVILDIGLPGISGFEVIKRLRARGCKTPILLFTARDHGTDRVKGLDLWADAYLLKPCDARELSARVRRIRLFVAVLILAVQAWSNYALAGRIARLNNTARTLFDALVTVRAQIPKDSTALIAQDDPRLVMGAPHREASQTVTTALEALQATDIANRAQFVTAIQTAWQKAEALQFTVEAQAY